MSVTALTADALTALILTGMSAFAFSTPSGVRLYETVGAFIAALSYSFIMSSPILIVSSNASSLSGITIAPELSFAAIE